MKYKVLLYLSLVCPWLLMAGGDMGARVKYISAKQVIDNKTDSKIRVTVKQGFLCRNRTWVVEPQEKKEIWLRTGCTPKSISISSYPKVGWLKFEVHTFVNDRYGKKIEKINVSEQPEFPIEQRRGYTEGWFGLIEEHLSSQWTLIIGPRRLVPVDSPIPVEARK